MKLNLDSPKLSSATFNSARHFSDTHSGISPKEETAGKFRMGQKLSPWLLVSQHTLIKRFNRPKPTQLPTLYGTGNE